MKRVSRLLLLAMPLALAGCVNLDSFLFNPEPVAEPYDFEAADFAGGLTEPHASLVPASHRNEGFATSAEGDSIHWVYARRDGARDTILYSHGNADHLRSYWERVEFLWEAGFNVLIYDYPGYGRSSGSPSEPGVLAAGEVAMDTLLAQPGVDASRVFLLGFSLGGGPSFHLAARGVRGEGPKVRGLLTEAVFCSVEALVQDGAFLDLPAGFVASVRFDNCARVEELDGLPVLLRHGADDGFVVPRHSELLAARGGANVTLELVPGAKHSDIPLLLGDDYLAGIRAFVEAAP